MARRLVTASRDDAAAIAALHTESWRSAYRGLVPDDFLGDSIVADRRRVWDERMAVAPDGDRLVLAAIEDEAMVGFTCVLRDADPAWGPLLDNLHVKPACKGRGIGRDLFTASREWSAMVSPGQPMHLWVIEGNVEARRFYDRQQGEVVECQLLELTPGIHVPSLRYVWR